ncbi:sensor histidine kinase [Paractinoplanes rishiriensis]|uniref:sensor histidine kinase n=1 Tax=Paractinoplanes rishiriensis TaxID=1050105 RepID=UPI0019435BBB|nr:ATP-binding protein [Actinoplanes rishiriensis]
MRSLRIAGGVVFAGAGVAATVAVLARGGGLSAVHVAVTPLVGWAFGVAGVLASLRERWRRVGLLLLAVGLAWFVHLADWTHIPVLVSATAPLRNAYMAVFGHLLLAFPTGRLRGRGVRALVVAGYLDAVGLHLAATLSDSPVLYDVEAAAGVVLACVAVGVLSRGDRLPAPVWAAAIVAFAALVGNLIVDRFAPGLALAWWVAFTLALAAVPFAFLAGLLGVRLRRAAVARLVVRLARVGDAASLRAAIAEAIGDPSLALAFWVPVRQGYVDASGHPATLPDPGGPAVATLVERDGHRIGALVHDAARRDPVLVDAVAAAAGLALDNARLQAELRANVAELEASRTRLVEATAAERRRIERNLHDGAQQRLVSVAFALGLARSRLAATTTPPAGPPAAGDGVWPRVTGAGDPAGAPDAGRSDVVGVLEAAQAGVAAALEDLRRLSQGIHPGVLAERGLRAALTELAFTAAVPVRLEWAAPDRLAGPVEETGYYVVAEALANAAKHSGASAVVVGAAKRGGSLVVSVRDDGVGGADERAGTGLRGLADRVAALGGRLTLTSPPGGGTTIEVEVPCG